LPLGPEWGKVRSQILVKEMVGAMARLVTSSLLAALLSVAPLSLEHGVQPKPAQAQEMLRIAAVVNDEIISIYDILQRTDFQILIGLGQQVTDESRNRLFPIMLRTMIDEKLMTQEAKRRGIIVQDDEIKGYVEALEASNNRPKGSVLKDIEQAGLRADTLMDQIRARLGWDILSRQKVRAFRPISDDEVDQVIADGKASQGQPEYLAADIFLSFDSAGGDAAAQRLVGEITRQLAGGARFSAVAQQYSNSASAATGGDLGWVRTGQIDPALLTALEALQPGQVSQPVRTVSGLHLLLLREKRAATSLPTRDEARQRLLGERLEAEGRRSLRDLRQAATIDIRI
jgi:peptidyl-prolyl cis-trans isomerase SurA